MKELIAILKEMNTLYGKGGTIINVNFNLNESEPDKGIWCGTVKTINPDDDRMFKIDNYVVTFLSHKRKLLISKKRRENV